MRWRCRTGNSKEEIQNLRVATMATLGNWGINSPGLLFEFNVILCELLANAVKHGNEGQPHKKVAVNLRFYQKNKMLFLLVCDQGKKSIKPAAGKDPLAESGRGLAIIASLAERCQMGCGRVWVRKKVINGE